MTSEIRFVVVLIAGLGLAGCETDVMSNVIDKSAKGDELRRETTVSAALPAGCPTVTTTLPPGKTSVTVSYREPTTNQTGAALDSLAFTTIYVSSATEQPRAIRVWTNDPHGGALVTIRDVPVQSQEVGLCVTATNWARKESAPAPPPGMKPSSP